MERETSLALRVVIFQEGSTWVAQVLERDMAAHGPTPYAALAAVQLVLQAHVNFDTLHRRAPLSALDPAPDVYVRAFEAGKPLAIPAPQPLLPAHIIAAISNDTPCRTV